MCPNAPKLLGTGLTSMALSAGEAAQAPRIVTSSAKAAIARGGTSAVGPRFSVGPFTLQGPSVTVKG